MSEDRKSVFERAAKWFLDMTDKLTNATEDKRGLYITLLAVAAAAIIMVGAITGFLLPRNSVKVTEKAEYLKVSEQKYPDAVKENESLQKRVDELRAKRGEVKDELDSITEYETARDSSKRDMDDVLLQLENLRGQIEQKKTEVTALDAQIRNMGGKITMSPGMYTVGEQISAGEYSVTGDGSLLVSSSQGKLKVNTKLTDTAPYTCRLSAGDIIKLETEAEFNAAG